MRLSEFINYSVEVVQPDDTVQRAAERMKDLDVESMPVCEGRHLVGILTDRDITIRATAQGADPTKTPVADVMTPDILYCFEDQEVEEAVAIMQENQIRRLCVLNENNELVGIVSLGELATVTGDHSLVGETLERVSDATETGQSSFGEPEQDDFAEKEEQATQSFRSVESGDVPGETRVTGLFHDRQVAKKAIEELKGAGFKGDLITVAMPGGSEDDPLIEQTETRSAAAEVIHSLHDLSSEDVVIMVEADERATEALDIISRNHGVTGRSACLITPPADDTSVIFDHVFKNLYQFIEHVGLIHEAFDACKGHISLYILRQITAGDYDLDSGIFLFQPTKDLFTPGFGKADIQQHTVDSLLVIVIDFDCLFAVSSHQDMVTVLRKEIFQETKHETFVFHDEDGVLTLGRGLR
jgi:CBS domain-containing protein